MAATLVGKQPEYRSKPTEKQSFEEFFGETPNFITPNLLDDHKFLETPNSSFLIVQLENPNFSRRILKKPNFSSWKPKIAMDAPLKLHITNGCYGHIILKGDINF